MDLVRYLVRIDVRRRWRNYGAIALLLGLTAGPALLAIAGARRTASAYSRFLRSVDASTVSISGFDAQKNGEIVGALPGVVQSRTAVGFNVAVLEGDKPRLTTKDLETTGTLDGRYFDQDRFTATTGRAPDPNRVDEIAVNEFAAKRFGLRVGQHLDLGTYSLEQIAADDYFTHPPPPKLRTAATIVAIGLLPDEVLQDDGDRAPRMLLTPAFSRAARQYVTYGEQGVVLARGDAGIGTVKQGVERRVPLGTVEIRVTSVDAFHAQQAVRPLAVALAAFGVLVGAASLVLTAQAIVRVLRTVRDERSTVRALGAPPASVARAATIGPLIAIVAGAALSVALAIALSPTMPIGSVRRVDPARGFDVDGLVLVAGVVVMVVLLGGFTAVLAYRGARHARRQSAPRPSRVVTAVGNAGLRAPALTGLRFALERPEESRAGVIRAAMFGATVAVAALVAAITFGVSLDTLVHEPRLYGWGGDAAITAAQGYGNIPLDGAHKVLDRDPSVAAWTGATFGLATLDGLDVPVLGIAPGSAVLPPVVHGPAPRDATEILVGATTASDLHKSIGDHVVVGGHRLTIAGIATFPTIGKVHAAHTSLGVGAVLPPDLVPGFDRDITGVQRSNLGPRVIFVRFHDGVDKTAELAHLRTTTQPLAGFAGLDVLAAQRPAEIVNSGEVGRAPILFAVALGIGALVSLGLALASSVRRHRRDLALLKTLGFTRRQLAATVAWHATTNTVVALVLGVPAGIVIGRSLWRLFAGQLDVVVQPNVPVAALAVLAGVALVAANAAAAAPARIARAVKASVLLRSE